MGKKTSNVKLMASLVCVIDLFVCYANFLNGGTCQHLWSKVKGLAD